MAALGLERVDGAPGVVRYLVTDPATGLYIGKVVRDGRTWSAWVRGPGPLGVARYYRLNPAHTKTRALALEEIEAAHRIGVAHDWDS